MSEKGKGKEKENKTPVAWLHCGNCEVGQEVPPIVAVADEWGRVKNGHFKYNCLHCGKYNYHCFGVENCRQ